MGKVSDWLIGMEEDAAWMSRDSWAAEHACRICESTTRCRWRWQGNGHRLLRCCRNRLTSLRRYSVAKPDPRIMHVADEVRRLMRIFSDLCLTRPPQDEIDAASGDGTCMSSGRPQREWSMSQDSKAVVCSKKLKFSDWDAFNERVAHGLRTPTP